MRYILKETTNTRSPHVIGEFEKSSGAIEHVHNFLKHKKDFFYMEEDKDYPGCYDIIIEGGRLFTIEPVGFKVKD